MFNIPIVLFIFKRADKSALIIDRLSQIKPTKLYIIADGARNDEEQTQIDECRRKVESHINWTCEVIKNYAPKNRGVFENIAGGAKWVFEKEESAIFLEDDNFPALSFFPFCQEMLETYKDNEQILWICGSNYLIKSDFKDGASYSFTQNMLPCGWASWAYKFNKYYQSDFQLWSDPHIRNKIQKMDYSRALKKQEKNSWEAEIYRKHESGKFASWDYQMSFTLRAFDLLGIIPKYNQIKNIGIDENSIHGGNSINNEMTSRFCENEILELEFPLIHPQVIQLDKSQERTLAKVITLPLAMRLKGKIVRALKFLLNINAYEPLNFKSLFK